VTSGLDGDVRGPAPVARYASHVDAKFAVTRDACRLALIQSPELHYLGHYTDGAYDFSYDRLGDIAGQLDPMDCERMGVQITNAVRGLDRMLREARTGALIRTVVHGQQGLAVCNSALPNEHVVGFSQAPSVLPAEEIVLSQLCGARKVDEILSILVTKLREQVSLGSQDPGSWISAKPGDVPLPPVDAPLDSEHCIIEGTADERIKQLFMVRVAPGDLQFVAYCHNGRAEFLVDQFDDPQLGPYFQEISVVERRLFYQNMCHQFPMIVRKFGRMTASVTGSRVQRVVLDVEQGGLFYYRITPGRYLIGVTIDQRRVASTDDKVGEIALRCRDNPVAPNDN
jgi:hypothetical protein